ncbi:NADH:flavin oxidoreductase [Nocardia cyriacigeorgica]|uniref:NADH:flavin oxidoreductase n=1 Tax=Nocardia cyriacigeorgica TaxID=135487 RepID=UPI0013D7113F|nr:NADH:flavin oxidoreductase [Nocardia cyriacigeorgica]NEW29621.1 NADH:flavin oxidoreductase [Nocardia cyriacigeorgica]
MSTVFAPAPLGPITLRNRVIKAATFEGRTPDALVTDDLIEYHRAPAAGGVAMSTVAYCAVSPEGRTDRHQIWMRPEAVPGLRRLTDAIHAEGAAASAQIGHAGPVANAASNRVPALAPGRMFSPLGMARTVRPDAAELRRVVRAFADAARTAEESGFDAVELHFGHNYLISSFFSPLLNHRRDAYGGSLVNRARLAREVAEAVREAVGGLRLEESLQIGRWLEADGTLDALELTIGSSLLNPMYLFHGDAPRKEFAKAFPGAMGWGMRLGGRFFLREYPYREAYMLDLARQFRYELKMPLVLLGGITTAETMQRAMDEGFEFVAMARALLRQPDLLLRIQQNANTPSLCTHCNKCMPSIFSRTTCVLAGPDQPVPR